MAVRKSKGLIQITDLDIFQINEVLRQLQFQIDKLSGLQGPLGLPTSAFGDATEDVAAAGDVGDSGLLAQSDHVHGHGSGYLPDAHHNKSHVHSGDGSGTVTHANLGSLSADDHAQYALLAGRGGFTTWENIVNRITGVNRFRHLNSMVRVYKSASQSINNTTDTTLTWDSESFDTDSLHDTVTNNSRLTAQIAGKYLAFAEVQWDTVATGNYRYSNLYKNGSVAAVFGTTPPLGVALGPVVTSCTIISLAAADYVEVVVKQDSGAALNVLGGLEANSHFGLVYLGE